MSGVFRSTGQGRRSRRFRSKRPLGRQVRDLRQQFPRAHQWASQAGATCVPPTPHETHDHRAKPARCQFADEVFSLTDNVAASRQKRSGTTFNLSFVLLWDNRIALLEMTVSRRMKVVIAM